MVCEVFSAMLKVSTVFIFKTALHAVRKSNIPGGILDIDFPMRFRNDKYRPRETNFQRQGNEGYVLVDKTKHKND